MEKIWEYAAINKVRFSSGRIGNLITPEQLFDLPLTSKSKASIKELTNIVKREIASNEDDDFITGSSEGNELLTVKLDLLKFVRDYKLKITADNKTAVDEKEEQEVIKSIIASKQHAELASLSVEDLQKKLK